MTIREAVEALEDETDTLIQYVTEEDAGSLDQIPTSLPGSGNVGYSKQDPTANPLHPIKKQEH